MTTSYAPTQENEPSELARLAFKAGESLGTARRAIRAVRDKRAVVDGAELRVLALYFDLSEPLQAELLEACGGSCGRLEGETS